METNQMAQCPEVQENLSAYVDGEVTKSERGMVEAHLTECGACREKLSETMRLLAAVAGLPRYEAGPSYMRALKERLAEPESIGDHVLTLLTGRGATAGFAFALGAAACFMFMVGGSQTPAPIPSDGSVEVAFARRTTQPVAPVQVAASVPAAATVPAGTQPAALPAGQPTGLLARASGVTPAVAAGAPVSAIPSPGSRPGALDVAQASAKPLVVASLPPSTGRGSLASLPALPAPPILAPGSARPSAIPAEVELENMKLDGGSDPAPVGALAAAPGIASSIRSTAGRLAAVSPLIDRAGGERLSGSAKAYPVGPLPARPTPTQEEIADAVQAVEPPVKHAELVAAVGAGTPLLEGDEAEREASSSDAGHQLQVMATRPAQFLAELTASVSRLPGVKITRVMILSQPALQVDLAFDGAQPTAAVTALKEQLNHLSSVKAVAAMTTDKDQRRGTILMPLGNPVSK